jgi:hypothetical protein
MKRAQQNHAPARNPKDRGGEFGAVLEPDTNLVTRFETKPALEAPADPSETIADIGVGEALVTPKTADFAEFLMAQSKKACASFIKSG